MATADENARSYFHQLDGHEDRIRRLEDLSLQFGPAVARIDEKLGAIGVAVAELKSDMRDVKDAAEAAASADAKRDDKLAALESTSAERKEGRKAFLKWAGGIIATVIVAAMLAFLGLKTDGSYSRPEHPSYSEPRHVAPAPASPPTTVGDP